MFFILCSFIMLFHPFMLPGYFCHYYYYHHNNHYRYGRHRHHRENDKKPSSLLFPFLYKQCVLPYFFFAIVNFLLKLVYSNQIFEHFSRLVYSGGRRAYLQTPPRACLKVFSWCLIHRNSPPPLSPLCTRMS